MNKKKAVAGTPLTAEQLEQVCSDLGEIYQWCMEGWASNPLPQAHRLMLWRVVDSLIKGQDPRVELGIPPKRGAPPQYNGARYQMAGHYWHLRATEKDAVARRVVADAWGVSTAQVWKVARPLREAWKERFQAGEFRTDNFESLAEIQKEQLTYEKQLRK